MHLLAAHSPLDTALVEMQPAWLAEHGAVAESLQAASCHAKPPFVPVLLKRAGNPHPTKDGSGLWGDQGFSL